MTLWFRPICDNLLHKFELWVATYDRGEVYATRDFLDYDGRVKPKVTAYSHTLALSPREMSYLVDMFVVLRPDSDILPEIKQVAALVTKGKKPRLLPGPEKARVVTLNFYKQVLEEILMVMREARDGKAANLEDLRPEGKELFEL